MAATPDIWLPLAVAVALLAYGLLVERRGRQLNQAEWTGIGLIALAAIAWFFRAGEIDWQNSRDWKKEWTYYAAIKEAMATHRLPWQLTTAFHYTNRYFSNPETVVSPHVLALAWMSIPSFVFFQLLLTFTAGLVAIRHLARELDLGPVPTIAFLAIFTLNGYMLGHLGGGHLQWIACFTYPAVFLFLHRLAAGDASRRTEAGLACSLAAMLLIGGWHMFVWAILFVAAFFVGAPGRWRSATVVALLTTGLAAFRVVPALIAHQHVNIEFLGSFRKIATLVRAFVGDPQPFDGMLWIEYDAYVGWIGFAILCAGATFRFGTLRRSAVSSLWLPSFVVFVLACSEVYHWTLFQLPGLNSQRVVTRFMIISLLGFALLGCVQLNEWLKRRLLSPARALAILTVGTFMAAQLLVRAGRLRPAADTGIAIPTVSVLLPVGPDASDLVGLAIGMCITLASLFIAMRMWTHQPESTHEGVRRAA